MGEYLKKGDKIKVVGGDFSCPKKGMEGSIKTVFKNLIRIETFCKELNGKLIYTFYKEFIENQIEQGNILLTPKEAS